MKFELPMQVSIQVEQQIDGKWETVKTSTIIETTTTEDILSRGSGNMSFNELQIVATELLLEQNAERSKFVSQLIHLFDGITNTNRRIIYFKDLGVK